MHPTVLLRPARPEDAQALADLAARTFTEAYEELDDPAELAAYVAEHFARPQVETVLAQPAVGAILAEARGELLGYALVREGSAPACVSSAAPVELWRLYVSQSSHGSGLGRALMQAAQAEARRRGGQSLWLSVYDRNLRAIRFYEKAGFARLGVREFLFGGRIYWDPVYGRPLPAHAA